MTDWKNRIVGSGDEDPEQLLANPGNFRIHPKVQQAALSGSLDTLGWIQQVIVNKQTGHVVDGHLRVSLALREGVKSVPVVYVDLSPEEEAQALMSLDPIAAMATTDKNKLDELLRQVQTDDANVMQFLTDLAEKNGLEYGEGNQVDAEPQIDRAEELRVKWGVETGQLWQLGEHRLICGDCTDPSVVEKVMGGERAKYGFHDPPYGIEVVGMARTVGSSKPFGSGRIGFDNTVKANEYSPVIGDDKPFDPSDVLNLSDYCVLWGANYYADKLPNMKGWLVWDKKGRDDWRDTFSDCELAWTNIKTVTRIFRHTWLGMVQEGEREKRVHPTQKPVLLYQKIINDLFKEDGAVLDCYSGSAPTLLACENLNRKCRAIEISPAYVAVALERWSVATGKTPVLVNEGGE